MKSLKKKVCVSVFLDELFENVDEDETNYVYENLQKIRKGETKIMGSQLIAEEILFKRVTRPRKYRNPLAISRRGRVYFRDQLRGLGMEEYWRPSAVEKVDRGTSTSLKSNDENDYDVDEYSQSDLNLYNLGLDGDEEEQPNWTRKAKRVDVALSTCFTENMSNAEKAVMETNLQILEPAKKLHEGTQTEGGAPVKGHKIFEDISENNKCFLVGRCAKSMNLAVWNHKSTQLTSLAPEQANIAREVSGEGSELEEVFHYMKSRKLSMNTLKRTNHVFKSQFVRTTEVLETNHNVIGDFLQTEEKWGYTEEKTECKIIRKGFCDVTVKTFVKTNREHILCYTLTVPWELTNLGTLIIPENSFRYSHTIIGSLARFTSSASSLSESGPSLMGTQCIDTIGKDCGTSNSVGPVIEELPREEEHRESEKIGEELIERSESGGEEPNEVEISTLEEHRVIESLAPEIITEQMKLLELRKEYHVVEDKSVNTETHTVSEKDGTVVQWELEIEIQSKESFNLEDTLSRTENSKTQMIKAIEGSSHTNVVLICQAPYENRLVIDNCSQHSRLSEIEQCYLKDEKIRRMYLANVPRRVLHVTEQKLKEIGRS